MSDSNKLFKFDLDRKLNSSLKFQPNFLTWLPYGKKERTTVYLLLKDLDSYNMFFKVASGYFVGLLTFKFLKHGGFA